MVSHFGDWVRDDHGLLFDPAGGDFSGALKRADGTPLNREEVWPLLDGFFQTEWTGRLWCPARARRWRRCPNRPISSC